ncbi:immunity 22 family protein [Pseudomonas putida]|uniref:Immunity protein 22 n=1 Tax=Pseudomonas putida (strain W619) TaxID=390235 RepID=B1J8V8_PSEPW|nr:immunity 22 family protein [Pseudomonas putida]QQE86506.1 immunity 22 family protein [Pseudomonas putida]
MDIYDIERYEKIHVWVGSNFESEADYLKYFELDYSVGIDDPSYKMCGFCKDVGIRWYDEDFIGIIPRSPQEVGLDEIIKDSSVDPSELDRLKAICLSKGINNANAIFWYSDGGIVVSEPLKKSYNGLVYIGLFEGN